MKRIEIKQLLSDSTQSLINTTINVKGWVRTKRGNKNVAFLNRYSSFKEFVEID